MRYLKIVLNECEWEREENVKVEWKKKEQNQPLDK